MSILPDENLGTLTSVAVYALDETNPPRASLVLEAAYRATNYEEIFRWLATDEILTSLREKNSKLTTCILFEKKVGRTTFRTWVCSSSGREICVSEINE